MRDSGHYADYGWKDKINIWTPEEGEGCGAFDDFQTIPVESEFKGLCAICDENEAKVHIDYEKPSIQFGVTFKTSLCFGCYSAPDFQDLLKTYDNVEISEIN